MSIKDPSASHALESSLWELELLRQHADPDVSKMVGWFDTPITRTRALVPLDDAAGVTFHSVRNRRPVAPNRSQVISRETARKYQGEGIPFAVQRPPGVLAATSSWV